MPHKKNPDVFELIRAKSNKIQSLPQQIMLIMNNLPVGYFLLLSGLSGAAFALVIAAMRCIAEAQIVPLESVFWLANLATGVFCGATIFAATFAALCATFFTAKRRRAKLEAELDSSDDI